eukprot:gnl/TRDRNA2_/TRDRNA2_148128_c1_seq1.p1 gnl/TRDRNA2_/TRDRNA2_148128_c1~~gnl/TRDRNA2_/TRDRNA2_148128_c1_seq1.p1  ORF type:complete len:447 (-),score=18.96 gnl/TRDRNA2_/TRDRNA2_148128_c1_seq1:193-1497(-)
MSKRKQPSTQPEIKRQKLSESKKVSSHICCPITMDVMTDPVMAADNRTYERAAIKQWLENNNTSPVTGLSFRDSVLRTNWAMRDTLSAEGYPVADVIGNDDEVVGTAQSMSSSSSSDVGIAGMPDIDALFDFDADSLFDAFFSDDDVPLQMRPSSNCVCRSRRRGDFSVRCRSRQHECICSTDPYFCKAEGNHPCVCDSEDGCFCKATAQDHKCICRDKPHRCKASEHECKCSVSNSWSSFECKAVGNHICVCASDNFGGCKAREHTCICSSSRRTSSCQAYEHACICARLSPRERYNCQAGYNFHKCICLLAGPRACWSVVVHECVCSTRGFTPWQTCPDCKASVHKFEVNTHGPSREESGNSNSSNGADLAAWHRVESRNHQGVYYYHNEVTGSTQVEPPPPWEKRTSRTDASVSYYWNPQTGVTSAEKPAM